MSSVPVGRDERAQAVESLKVAQGDGLLDRAECERRVRQVMQARTHDELLRLLTDLSGDGPGAGAPVATRYASMRDRVADWLVRALRRAVFCWLPPPRYLVGCRGYSCPAPSPGAC